MRIWQVMDECIRTGVSTSETTLPGRLGLRRRAPMLYRRLMRGWVWGFFVVVFLSIFLLSFGFVNFLSEQCVSFLTQQALRMRRNVKHGSYRKRRLSRSRRLGVLEAQALFSSFCSSFFPDAFPMHVHRPSREIGFLVFFVGLLCFFCFFLLFFWALNQHWMLDSNHLSSAKQGRNIS